MRFPVRPSFVVCSLLALVVVGCAARTDRMRGGGGGGDGDGGGGGFDGGVRSDGSVIDPFDPDAACGYDVVPSQREPGSILVVFDYSSSMNEDSRGNREGDMDFRGPTKWELTSEAFSAVLPMLPDDVNVGLLFFPNTGAGEPGRGGCEVQSDPAVPLAPLGTNRSALLSALSASRSPSGSNTPIKQALTAGYEVMSSASSRGGKAVILITDGAENCADGAGGFTMFDPAPTFELVRAARETGGVSTYSVGLSGSAEGYLSEIAIQGGTRITDICAGANYMGSLSCEERFNPANIFMPFPADGPCCHYIAEGSTFATQISDALRAIASRFLDTCIFTLPRGDMPGMFDPAFVNVRVVSADGMSPPVVVRFSVDPSVSSWNFYDDTYESIILQGPICEDLKAGRGNVEIVLGCPTILI
jgi:hypothetical protein